MSRDLSRALRATTSKVRGGPPRDRVHDCATPNCGGRSCGDNLRFVGGPGQQERELTLAEMQAIMRPYTGARARKVEAQGGWCEPTPVGVDSRNGRPLYIRMHCDDLCPDYSQFLMTYGPDIPAGAPCEADGYCTLYSGASISPIYCMPYAQGYSQCGSASLR